MSRCLFTCKYNSLKTLLIATSHCLLSAVRVFCTMWEVDPRSLTVWAEQQTVGRQHVAGKLVPFSVPQELSALQMQQVFLKLAKGLHTGLTGMFLGTEGGCWFRRHNTWHCAGQGRCQDRRLWSGQKEQEEGQNKTVAVLGGGTKQIKALKDEKLKIIEKGLKRWKISEQCREALVVIYLLAFSVSYMSENVRKIHLRPHTETSAFLWQRPGCQSQSTTEEWFCKRSVLLSRDYLCIRFIWRALHKWSRTPNYSTHNEKKWPSSLL